MEETPKNIISVDPTQNVLKLVEEAVKRQDDLMAMTIKHQDELRMADNKRGDELRIAEAKRIDDLMKLRSEYEDKLQEAEAKRIDAIRAVDVNAVSVASERAAATAQVLATQVTASADAIRSQLQTSNADMNDRISKVEKAQYESAGKSGVTDPMIAEFFQKIDKLIASNSTHTGETKGRTDVWGWLMGAAGIVIAVLTYLAMK